MDISAEERQQKIGTVLERTGRLSIAQICTDFGISEATARRDLEALAGHGRIRRVRGGAIFNRVSAPEEPILRRSGEQGDEKERIGRAAAALVHDGETVFIGSGTTAFQTALHLTGRAITLITNSLPIINLMAERSNITLVAVGGSLRASELSFIGHLTEQVLGELRADRVIIGARAISLEHGLTNDYLPETQTDRAILNCGREVAVVADHTKCGMVAAAFLAPLRAVNMFITGREAAPDFVNLLREQGVQVIIA